MSKPAPSSVSLVQWASSTNYPISVNPWSGTPTKVAYPNAALYGFVPGTGESAQVFNYGFANLTTSIASLQTNLNSMFDSIGGVDVNNWGSGLPDGSTAADCRSIAFDIPSNRIVVSCFLSPNYDLRIMKGGLPTSSFGSLAWSPTPTSLPYLGYNPTGLIVAVDGRANVGYYLTTGSNSLLTVTLGGITSTDFFDVKWLASASLFFAVGGGSAMKMITGTGNANWTDATAAVPSALATIALANTWKTGVSSTLAIAMPVTTNTTSYMTSTDAVTWTLRTSAPAALNEVIDAVHHNATTGKWMMVFRNTITGALAVWTSDDGITGWTKMNTSSLTAIARLCNDVSHLGQTWLMVGQENIGFSGQENFVVYASNDNGAHWAQTDLCFGSTTVTNARMRTDGSRVYISGSALSGSIFYNRTSTTPRTFVP